MRLRTLRQQQLEDAAKDDPRSHSDSDVDTDGGPTYPAPIKWQPHSLLDRHLNHLTPPSLSSASRLSLQPPSLPVPLDSLQARLYANSQLLRWTHPALDIDNSDGRFPLLAPAVCPYVTACRFDRLGSLLACASSSGRLVVLDMDIALAQPLRQPSRTLCAEAVRSYNMPSFRVDCLRWQPGSDDCIVVSSTQHHDILHFDLNHSSDQPKARSTLPSSSRASAIADFTFVPSQPQLLIAATGEGGLQWWDMRAGRLRNPAVPHTTSVRVPCALSASPTLPLVYVWRADASVDVYDVRRVPAERRRQVHAWRLVDGGLNRLKAVQPDDNSEARFLLETEGGGVSVFDVWSGGSARVESKQQWTGDMAALGGGRRRRVAWMNGLGGGDGGRLQRGCTRIVAHATGGPEVKFSRVPLHSRGHHTLPAPLTAGSAESEGLSVDEELVLDGDEIDWSDDNDQEDIEPADDDDDDTARTQATIHSYFQPFNSPPQPLPQQLPLSPPQPAATIKPPRRLTSSTAEQQCACCSHVVGGVSVGGGGVSVMESHPSLDVLVCGMLNNELALVGASRVADEDEEREEVDR